MNGQLLTLVSERQGGVYLQNPNAPGSDLKHYFVKAFGSISGETVLIDPEGTIAPTETSTPAVEDNSCSDDSLTFSAVWDKAIDPLDLRLLVTSPSGDLVVGSDPQVEASSERLWSNARVDLPYRTSRVGVWRAELARPHRHFVNGFSPSAFADPNQGIELIRRQIHRLCPTGCKEVLHYENGFEGDFVYESALKLEAEAGLIGAVDSVRDPDVFAQKLNDFDWSLVVSAQGGDDRSQSFDPLLQEHICRGGLAIVSDSRAHASAGLLRCAGTMFGGDFRGKVIAKSPSLNFTSDIDLRDPGNLKETWSLIPIAPSQAVATGAPNGDVAIVARAKEGLEQRWFIDVLWPRTLQDHSRQLQVALDHR